VYSENEVFDADIDVNGYCRKVQELYKKFCDCYTTEQVTVVIDDQLNRMQVDKISIKGNLFFVPDQYLPLFRGIPPQSRKKYMISFFTYRKVLIRAEYN